MSGDTLEYELLDEVLEDARATAVQELRDREEIAIDTAEAADL